MLCMYIFYYVSMVSFIFMYVVVYILLWCGRMAFAKHRSLKQLINQSIGINPVGDCSEMTVLGFRSLLLVTIINQVLRIIKM